MLPIKQKGAGLIEVMVSLVVLSIGMLGIGSLQATAMQAGQAASLRTAALTVVEDMASRMKANKLGVYDIAAAVGSYDVSAAGTGTNNNCNDANGGVLAVVCSGAQMAAHDIFLWKTSLDKALPAGTGEIATTVAAPAIDGLVTVTIKVTWQHRGNTREYVSVFKMSTQ